MGTITDKLTYLGQTKAEIRDAILSKGVAVPVAATFRDYAGKIREIATGGESENPEQWQRPTDWLPIEDKVAEGDQKFVGLLAIYEEENFISLSATGNYTVDWGDGVVENFIAGTQADHTYAYSSFPGTETTGGYRQTIVTVTPQSGQNLTGINLQQKHRESGSSYYTTGWLDIRMSGSKMINLTIGGQSIYHRALEAFCFLGSNAISGFRNLFYRCNLLQSIAALDTSNGTDFNNMFHECFSLKTIPLLNTAKGTAFNNMFYRCTSLKNIPLLNTSNGINFSQMFYECASLKTIPLLDTSKGTTLFYMFSGCTSLESIPLLNLEKGVRLFGMFDSCSRLQTVPPLNTASGVEFNIMFSGCTSLKTAPLLNTPNGTDFSSMFSKCTFLKEVPLYKTSSGTNFRNMFANCTVLQTIPALDTAKGTDFGSMFLECVSLQTVPVLNTANGTNFTTMFSNCDSLNKATLSGTKETISYTKCKLSRAALVDIFNNLASGVTAKTITITNNWGSVLLTPEDRAIATDKGWTIVG